MIAVTLTENDKGVIQSCLFELGGYAGKFLQDFLPNEQAEKISEFFRYPGNAKIELEKEQWLKLYHLINAVIYELGEEELQTIAGFALEDIATANRKIFTTIHNRHYGGDFK